MSHYVIWLVLTTGLTVAMYGQCRAGDPSAVISFYILVAMYLAVPFTHMDNKEQGE